MSLLPLITGNVRTIGTFQQANPDSLEFLARRMFRGLIDHAELLNEVERDGGMELQEVLERSGSTTRSRGTAKNWSEDESESDAESWSLSIADALSWGKTRANQEGETEDESRSAQKSGGESERIDPEHPMRRLNERTLTATEAQGNATRKGKSRTHSESETEGGSLTRTGGSGGAKTKSRSNGRGGAENEGEANTEGWSLKHIQVRKVIREKVRTGQLDRAVADQYEKHMQGIYCLMEREAFFCIGSQVVKIRTHDVPEPFRSPAALVKAVHWLLRELPHKYLFVPDLSAEEEERRVNEFLANPAAAVLIDDELA